jgi:hypothetical protein
MLAKPFVLKPVKNKNNLHTSTDKRQRRKKSKQFFWNLSWITGFNFDHCYLIVDQQFA